MNAGSALQTTQKGLAMSETYELKAEARDRVGKGSARAVRRNGMIPAIIYGDKKEPLPIAISFQEVALKLHRGGFMTTVATIDVGGEKIRVLPKDYQLDKVRDFPLHVDFLRVSKNTVVTVEIPVHFVNEETSKGLKRGGVLNIVRHEVEVECRADAIPESFEIDLAELDIDDVVHASDLVLPENVKFVIDDRDFTVCSIAPPKLATEDDEADADAEDEADEDAAEDEASDDAVEEASE
jgi:large subunit ribosomal protein L25